MTASPPQNVPALKVQRLRPSARLPERSTPGSSGLDLYADLGGSGETLDLSAMPQLVPTGIAIELPAAYEVQLRPRSGLSSQGVVVAFGTVDSDYRGEVLVNMAFRGDAGGTVRIRHGDRIAQLVVAPVVRPAVEEVDALSQTERGSGGFGSSGR